MFPEEELINAERSLVENPPDVSLNNQKEEDLQTSIGEQAIIPEFPTPPEAEHQEESAPMLADSSYCSQILFVCQSLQSDFQSKLKYDSHKEKIIDALHAELQAYKNGLLEKLLRPIFMDIIDVTDDTRKLLKDLSAKGEDDNRERLRKIAASLPVDLEDLLYKHGVEVLNSDGDDFNPAVQKVVKTVETDDEMLDKKICERLKNGYTLDGKLIRHEMVSVWQFKKKESNP